MESSAFTALTEQIAEIAAHVRAVSGERKEKSADRLLTTREAAHLLNVSTRTLWKSHATLTLLAKQDLPTFGYNMIDPLKSWCWGSILFYPFKISRFS